MAKKKFSGRLLRITGGDWIDNHLAVKIDPKATVECEVSDGGVIIQVNSTWRTLPPELQAQILFPYPVCICGRRRVNEKENGDGYTRCTFCRNEEHCNMCNSAYVRVTVVDGQKVCQKCLPMAQEMANVSFELTDELVGKLVSEAAKLLSSQIFTARDGELVASELLPHHLKSEWSGWQWYYISKGRVWGTHLSPEALQIFLHLDGASSPEGKRRLVQWIIGGPHRGGTDFFTLTQVKGFERATPPALTKEACSQLRLAVLLKG